MSNIHEVVAAIINSQPAMIDRDGNVAVSADITPEYAVVRNYDGPSLSQAQLDKASIQLDGIISLARAWQWTAVEQKFDRAYKALGSEHESTGYDFHRGSHPTQQYL